MNFHIGIVEDRQDPLQLGRVRVRVFGIHSDSKVDIPTEGLPWASVMQPTTSSAMSGVGTTPKIVEGTQVIIIFSDGDDMQQPVVIGTMPGINQEYYQRVDGVEVNRTSTKGFSDPKEVYPTETYKNESDLPKLARQGQEHTRTQTTATNSRFSVTEPSDIRGNSRYPYNQVRQSESGHYEEWDDTPGNERLNRQHKSGTFEEIRPNGDRVEKIVRDNYTLILQNDNVYVEGVCNLHIQGNANTHIGGDWNINVAGNQNITVAGTITETATNVNNNYNSLTENASTGEVNYSGGEITVSGITHTKHRHTDTPGLGAGTTSGPRG